MTNSFLISKMVTLIEIQRHLDGLIKKYIHSKVLTNWVECNMKFSIKNPHLSFTATKQSSIKDVQIKIKLVVSICQTTPQFALA